MSLKQRTPETMLKEIYERIARRKEYLYHRVKDSEKDLSFDKAELTALSFICDFILDNKEITLDYLEKWMVLKNLR